MAPPVIDVRDLVKDYDGVRAVDGISFTVGRGETYGLLGPNGAGKTSTMRMLAGLSPITAGRIRVGGLDVARQPRAVRRLLGVVTQSDGLDTELTVRQNLEIFGALAGLSRARARARADEVLAFFDLSSRGRDEVEELSGGLKRRVAIARALMPQPEVIVLDEPSTGLDPESRTRVWEELAVLQQAGVTVLMSTHYMDEAETLCDRVAILHSGRILDEDTPPALVARHAGSRVAEVRLEGAPRDLVRKALAEAGLAYREVGALFRVAAPEEGRPVLPGLPGVRVVEREADLEDVFLSLAGRRLGDE